MEKNQWADVAKAVLVQRFLRQAAILLVALCFGLLCLHTLLKQMESPWLNFPLSESIYSKVDNAHPQKSGPAGGANPMQVDIPAGPTGAPTGGEPSRDCVTGCIAAPDFGTKV